MRTRTLVIAAMLLAACFVAPEDHNLGSPFPAPLGGNSPGTGGGSGGGAGGGGSRGGGTGAGFERCVELPIYDDLVCATVSPVRCSGVLCPSGDECCQTTGACVTPGSGACPKHPTTGLNNPTACGSNSDCSSTEYCVPDEHESLRCIGLSGHCESLMHCAYCSAPGSDYCQVCGCNGITYASPQEACIAGVTAPHRGPCGVPAGFDAGTSTVSCGTDAQCPANAQCCFLTGTCFDAAEQWRCQLQPNGSMPDCLSDAECNSGGGTGGGGGGGGGNQAPTGFCAGEGCSGPGVCSARSSSSSCGGEVQTVCGCDGVTYVNACWARAAGTRVANTGTCP